MAALALAPFHLTLHPITTNFANSCLIFSSSASLWVDLHRTRILSRSPSMTVCVCFFNTALLVSCGTCVHTTSLLSIWKSPRSGFAETWAPFPSGDTHKCTTYDGRSAVRKYSRRQPADSLLYLMWICRMVAGAYVYTGRVRWCIQCKWYDINTGCSFHCWHLPPALFTFSPSPSPSPCVRSTNSSTPEGYLGKHEDENEWEKHYERIHDPSFSQLTEMKLKTPIRLAPKEVRNAHVSMHSGSAQLCLSKK